MGMSDFYGPADRADSIALLRRAVELGVDFFDTADVYGRGHNEVLVGEALGDLMDKVTVATKFGFIRDDSGAWTGFNGHPDYVPEACARSLERLGVDTIDLYYAHRVDPNVPVEDMVGAMARLVDDGKVRQLGLSEASADELRRAHAVHPITALQTELSLWSRDATGEILDTCDELGITFVAYSPLGRGFLTGAIKSRDALTEDDYRLRTPRFEADALRENLALVERIEQVAGERWTLAQVALAWVLAQSDNVCAIPGTRSEARLIENLGALDIELDDATLVTLDHELPAAIGARY